MQKLIIMTFQLLLSFLFLIPDVAVLAETKEIVAEGTYTMGDGETPVVAEGRAVEQAKRTAVEQAGTYVKSYSHVKNFQLADDDIEVLASGIMEITIIDKKRTVEADAIKFWVRIKAIVKPDNIEVVAERVRENGLGEEYDNIKAAYDQSQEQIAQLRQELAAAKAEPARQEIIGKVNKQEQQFQSQQLYADALQNVAAGRADEALAVVTRLIGEHPDFAPAYVLRGFIYSKQEKYDKACPDFDRAIVLMPNAAKAYAGRGMCRRRSNQCEAAISDLEKSLKMDRKPSRELKERVQANLGGCIMTNAWEEYRKGDYERAFRNFDRAVKLLPTSAGALAGRGVCYSRKNRCREAVADLSKSLRMDPGPPQDMQAGVHAHLGRCLLQEGEKVRAREHFQTACTLGEQEACKALQQIQLRRLR